MTHNDDSPTSGFGNGPGGLLDDGAAVVAGVVIETRPGQGPFVAIRLEGVPDLEIVGGDGNHRLAAVWSAPSGKALESAVERLVQTDDDVLGVFPTFIGRDDEEEPEAAARTQALGGIARDRGSDG